MRLRPARPADWPELERAFVAAGREAWRHILGPEALDRLSPPTRWGESVDHGEVVVAEEQGAVVGFTVELRYRRRVT